MKTHNLAVSSIRKNNYTVPLIRFSGQWLAQYGFQIGSKLQVQIQPGRIIAELQSPEDERGTTNAGFLVIQHNGRYAICNRSFYHELSKGDLLAVDMGNEWMAMKIHRDMEGYYLKNQHIAFYPKMVYVRLLDPAVPQDGMNISTSE